MFPSLPSGGSARSLSPGRLFQWGHGSAAVESRGRPVCLWRQSGFNAATALLPWNPAGKDRSMHCAAVHRAIAEKWHGFHGNGRVAKTHPFVESRYGKTKPRLFTHSESLVSTVSPTAPVGYPPECMHGNIGINRCPLGVGAGVLVLVGFQILLHIDTTEEQVQCAIASQVLLQGND